MVTHQPKLVQWMAGLPAWQRTTVGVLSCLLCVVAMTSFMLWIVTTPDPLEIERDKLMRLLAERDVRDEGTVASATSLNRAARQSQCSENELRRVLRLAREPISLYEVRLVAWQCDRRVPMLDRYHDGATTLDEQRRAVGLL